MNTEEAEFRLTHCQCDLIENELDQTIFIFTTNINGNADFEKNLLF